jgi:hypothetical protein
MDPDVRVGNRSANYAGAVNAAAAFIRRPQPILWLGDHLSFTTNLSTIYNVLKRRIVGPERSASAMKDLLFVIHQRTSASNSVFCWGEWTDIEDDVILMCRMGNVFVVSPVRIDNCDAVASIDDLFVMKETPFAGNGYNRPPALRAVTISDFRSPTRSTLGNMRMTIWRALAKMGQTIVNVGASTEVLQVLDMEEMKITSTNLGPSPITVPLSDLGGGSKVYGDDLRIKAIEAVLHRFPTYSYAWSGDVPAHWKKVVQSLKTRKFKYNPQSKVILHAGDLAASELAKLLANTDTVARVYVERAELTEKSPHSSADYKYVASHARARKWMRTRFHEYFRDDDTDSRGYHLYQILMRNALDTITAQRPQTYP